MSLISVRSLLCFSILTLPFASAQAQSTCSAPATARSVQICAPANNTVNGSPVQVLAAARAGSSPVTRMEVWVDGAKKYQASSTAQVDTSLALAAGMHRITVQAIDSTGVFKSSVNITLSAGGSSCTAPGTSRTLRICAPGNGATVSSPVNVEAAANQSTTIQAMQLYVDGVKKYETAGARLSAVVSPASGTHRLTVQAQDATGWFKSTATVTVAGGVVTETVASGLFVPWEIVWAPDGRMFFTEQIGKLRVVENGALVATPMLDLRGITPGGEAGMLGLEVDPEFSSNHYLYLFYCFQSSTYASGFGCRIARLKEAANTASLDRVLLEFMGGKSHNAGRIKLGRDGLLYVAVGDFRTPANAQDLNSFGGKILRMTLEGSPAPGNPFAGAPYVFSYGHRDPQGLAFDSSGQLYATEHGEVSHDEINLISAGQNFGWPTCQGVCNDARFRDPWRLFYPETAAPSGATFYYSGVIPQWNGSLFFGTLGLADNTYAHHLHRIKLDSTGTHIAEEETLFLNNLGRIRVAAQGPDGYLYLGTSNGNYSDKIIRVKPQ